MGFKYGPGPAGFAGGGGGSSNELTLIDPILDLTASGVKQTITVGESVVFGNLLYVKSDGKWYKSDADAAATMPGLRLALETKSADTTCSTLVYGLARDDTWDWTINGFIYASTITGGLTQTAPSGQSEVVQVIGIAYHADRISFQPSLVTVVIDGGAVTVSIVPSNPIETQSLLVVANNFAPNDQFSFDWQNNLVSFADLYYPFAGGATNAAKDKSSNVRNLAVTGPPPFSATGGPTVSVPSYLTFNGTTNRADATGYKGVTFENGLGQISVAFWMRVASAGSGFDTIVGWGTGFNSNDFRIVIDSSGFILLGFGGNVPVNSNVNYRDDTWHHVVVTYPGDDAGASQIWVDAIDVSNFVAGIIAPTVGTTNDVRIGASVSTTEFYQGDLADFRVYDFVLTDEQISLLAAGTIDRWIDSTVPRAIDNFLVGHYKLNDNIATTTIIDSAPNPVNGTITGGENSEDMSVAGKVGTALTFDGNDAVMITSTPKLNDHISTTIVAWVNTTVATGTNMQIAGRFIFRVLRNNQANGGVLVSAQGPVSNFSLGTINISDGLWHLVVATFDNATYRIYVDGILDSTKVTTGTLDTVNQDFEIASNGTSDFFTGELDNIRSYNRALSIEEIRAMYADEAPIMVAGFEDDAASTIVGDSSRRSDNLSGVIVGGNNSSDMSVPGRVKSAFSFDGTSGQRVNMGNNARFNNIVNPTISAWIKVSANTNGDAMLAGKDNAFGITRNGTTNKLKVIAGGLTPSSLVGVASIEDDEWHHIIAIYDGTTLFLIIDSVLDASIAASGTLTTTGQDFTIGGNAISVTEVWNGLIDDVRVFERPLVFDQIKELYNKTRACVFGYDAISETLEECSDDVVIASNVLWTPSEITTLGWYDTSDTATITDVAGAVSQLADIGTSGIQDMVQATGVNQPTTGTRTINGLNVLDCDGTDEMERAAFIIPASGDISVFMVAEIDTIDNVNDSVYSMDATNDFQFDANNISQFNGAIDVDGIGADVGLTGGPFAGPSIYNTNFDFAGDAIYNAFIDGTQRAVDTAYTTKLDVSQTFRLFTDRPSSAQPDGAFGETVATEDVTIVTRELIEGYLANKWGLTANLPVGHPFKLVAPLADVIYATTIDGIVVVDGLPVIIV